MPAAVGVVMFVPVLRDHLAGIAVALVASVVATIAVSAWLLKVLSPREPDADGAPRPAGAAGPEVMSGALPPIREIWVYLSGSPLLALTLTLAAWQLGTVLYERSGRDPLVNPVAIAVAAVAAAILALGMPYPTYFEGAQFVHFLLGTATVSLAVPMPVHRGLTALRGRVLPLAAALLGGGATSIGVAIGCARLLGVDAPLQQGMWAKSVSPRRSRWAWPEQMAPSPR